MSGAKAEVPLSNVSLYNCGLSQRNSASQSVSWNSLGTTLASALNNSVKLWPCPSNNSSNGSTSTSTSSSTSSTNNTIRETATLEHRATVDRVRFHPSDPHLLCTNVKDRTVQLWDVRVNHQNKRPTGKIDLKSNAGDCAASIEWFSGNYSHSSSTSTNSSTNSNTKDHYLVVSEKNNSVYIYDMRKLQQSKPQHQQRHNQKSQLGHDTSSGQIPIQSFHLSPDLVKESKVSPSGTHLLSAAMGCLLVYPCNKRQTNPRDNRSNSTARTSFVGHTGPIYSFAFSPNGERMATGGADTLVGLWDVKSMVCTSTITRRTKFIRSVSFSFDSKLVACCSEEEGVDVSNALTGELIGNVSLTAPTRDNNNNNNKDRFRSSASTRGADEIAFHPKNYLLACARNDDSAQVPQVTIAKIQDLVNR